jgi:hypothetical protein
VVFRRRDRRPIWRIIFELFWPRGGWGRAARYVQYRVRRLPDTPEKIGRGIWAGVFVTFTPFFGLHFFISVFLAGLMRGNLVAALLATFFGNPLTYIPIAATSLWFGHMLLGQAPGRLDINARGDAMGGSSGLLPDDLLSFHDRFDHSRRHHGDDLLLSGRASDPCLSEQAAQVAQGQAAQAQAAARRAGHGQGAAAWPVMDQFRICHASRLSPAAAWR